jgi:hypothetical protein
MFSISVFREVSGRPDLSGWFVETYLVLGEKSGAVRFSSYRLDLSDGVSR